MYFIQVQKLHNNYSQGCQQTCTSLVTPELTIKF